MKAVIEKDVQATMRDGSILRANIFRPADDGEYPVLVLRTPYQKESDPLRLIDGPLAALNGFIVVAQDVRGRWASDGDVFYFLRSEFEDGHDTVEWASRLPGSNGRVGLFGVSYPGYASWQAAVTAPPALSAIAPSQSPSNFYDSFWRGGALQWGFFARWALNSIGPGALLRQRPREDGALPPEFLELADNIDHYDDRVYHLPIREWAPAKPSDRSFLPWLFDVFEHPVPDDYTRSMSVGHLYDKVRVPALITTGWHDIFIDADLKHFQGMRESAATEIARDQTKVIVGPWPHAWFYNFVGDVDFGVRAGQGMIDLREDMWSMHFRWFNRWLRDEKNGVDEDPPVRIFVQGINRWRESDTWPLPGATSQDWYFGHDGQLGRQRSDEPGRDSYIYDPADPCPTLGGTLLLPGTYDKGPVDQTSLLGRRDVLVYTSPILEEDVEVIGQVKAVLNAATTAVDTDWVVKLCDVQPDGTTLNVCDGILRARYRHGIDRPEMVQPASVEEYEVDLWSTAWVFQSGHRIRVLVTSSDFPRYDRNPNTGSLGIDAREFVPAMQTIFRETSRPSRIVLPVMRAC